MIINLTLGNTNMPRIIRMTDLNTGQETKYEKLHDCAEVIRKESGINTSLGTLTRSIQQNKPVYGRFQLTRCGKTYDKRLIDGSDRYMSMGGWKWYQFELAQTVICGERRIHYDEATINLLVKRLKKRHITCNFDFDFNDNGKPAKEDDRKTTRIEVYGKFGKDVTFKEKINKMLEVLDEEGVNDLAANMRRKKA